MSTTLQDLVNSAVFLSTETQSHFGRLIAEASWEVDFTADPQLTFSAEDGPVLRARPHLLGSESRGTWLWGWENVNDFPEPVVDLSHQVRRFGAGESVPELTTAELELDDELALRLTLAAKAATGIWAHYPAGAGAGTTVWLLVEAPELTLPAPQVKTTVRALMQGLSLTTVDDHRAALDAYVARRGVPTVVLPEDGIRLLFADGCADLSFDDQRRISNCEVHSPLEGEAAEQFAQASAGAPSPAGESTPAGTAAAESGRRQESPEPAAPKPAPSEAQVPTEEETQTPAEATAPEAPQERPAEPAATQADGGSARRDSRAEDTARAEDAAAGEPARQEAGSQETESEQTEKPKKKGLFSKLFGR